MLARPTRPSSAPGASNAPVDLRQAMQRMTLEIAGRTMFSVGMIATAAPCAICDGI